MYTSTQSKMIYGLTIIVACVGIMASCSEREAHATSIASMPPAPYVAPFVPLGDCLVPYWLKPGQTKLLKCALASPAGLDIARAVVMATVATGELPVSSWIVFAGEFGPPSETIFINFAVHNTGAEPVEGDALVTAAVAQRTTPAVAAAGAL